VARFSGRQFTLWTAGGGVALVALAAAFAASPASAGKGSPLAGGAKNCNSASACLARSNAGSGAGVQGASAGGNGVSGSTTLFSTTAGAAGISGVDLATPNPQGTPLNNSGVFGQSANGMGVFGTTSAGIGVRASATTGTAIDANAAGGDGVFGTTQSNVLHEASAGVFGEDVGNSNSAFGMLGFSRTGIGVQGDNFEVSTALNAAVVGLTFASNINTYFPAFPTGGLFNSDTGEGMVAETSGAQAEALGAANFGGGPIMRGYAARTEVMELDNGGNMTISGKLTQHGTPGIITRTQGAGDVVMYAPSQAVASVEDVGEARLAHGATYVRLDPRFAATMNRAHPYLVFVTPQGDVSGLYVTDKGPDGFAVREHGGASDAAFDYRIVAEPYGTALARLPQAPRLTARGFVRVHSSHRSDLIQSRGVLRR
jgi:hypothetical protein